MDDLGLLEKIRKLAIIAMFSDDDLMNILVLKGGNALDIVYRVNTRASKDLDFSMEEDFKETNMIKSKIENALTKTFEEAGYEVFDIGFTEEPPQISPDLENFWGGYKVVFKIIEKEKSKNLDGLKDLRRNAIALDEKQRKKFYIDISKFEYCSKKTEAELDGYTIYVYPPEMIVLEKIRALCQRMPNTEYKKLVKLHSAARARDFFDIYVVLNKFKNIDITSEENIEILRKIFEAKKVPLSLIGKIKDYKEFHREDFESVLSTVKQDTELKDFDFYFDYVVDLCNKLQPLWKI